MTCLELEPPVCGNVMKLLQLTVSIIPALSRIFGSTGCPGSELLLVDESSMLVLTALYNSSARSAGLTGSLPW